MTSLDLGHKREYEDSIEFDECDYCHKPLSAHTTAQIVKCAKAIIEEVIEN